MSKRLTIVEVGPRDGLQNEAQVLTLPQKLEFIRLLLAAGHRRIEIGAFVNPKRVPQMADSAALFSQLKAPANVRLSALVPNDIGYQEAIAAGVQEIAVFTAASETFNQRNTNASISESLERFAAFLPAARKRRLRIRGYISTAFGCPFEGDIDPQSVVKLARQLLKLGVQELSIGDTIGIAVPSEVSAMCRRLQRHIPSTRLAMHFHDTRGSGLANLLAALYSGIRIFDSSAGGLGGCPFAPRSTGNIATDDALYMLHKMGWQTGIDLKKHLQASLYMQGCLGRALPSRYLQSQIS